ncbi:rhodanese-like domain-containing protein [Pseudoalteromonas sp. SSDWG2]|uniref:rhodanese-like domain-containing protein n=1 Tax=Pseudoalteromonas sp. SSDWG2 TaxID=3139391 RepID=UPI003BA9994F
MEQYIEFIGNHPILSIIWLIIVVMLVSGWFKSKFSAIKQINPQQLTLLVNRENAVIADIRPQKDFNNGRIANSVHLSAEKAKQSDFAELEKHKSNPIILVCATGMTASGIANNLTKSGFESVYILSGGMQSWQNAGLPQVSGK